MYAHVRTPSKLIGFNPRLISRCPFYQGCSDLLDLLIYQNFIEERSLGHLFLG
jgi:hypothetical protein